MGPVLAGELDHVGEAGRGEQRGACGAPLQQRVGGHRHAMREVLDVLRACAGQREHRPHRLEHRQGLRGGRRGNLGCVDGRVVVEQDRVGEGAADVYAQEHG